MYFKHKDSASYISWSQCNKTFYALVLLQLTHIIFVCLRQVHLRFLAPVPVESWTKVEFNISMDSANQLGETNK